MRRLVFYACFVSIALGVTTLGNRTRNCCKRTFIYESMGCEPVFRKPEDDCPGSYDCSAMQSTPPTECHLQGKRYKRYENIPNELTWPFCSPGCFCYLPEQEENATMTNVCSGVVDCVEAMNPAYQEMYNKDCYSKYSHETCCSVGKVCPPFDHVPKCRYKGKTYYDGQKFAADDCSTCVCGKGFRGKWKEPFCKKIKCIDEGKHMKEIDNHFAPYYLPGRKCCPLGWLEPGSADPVFTKMKTAGPKCRFGSNFYDVGACFTRIVEILEYEELQFTCCCDVPPLLACEKRILYDKEKTPYEMKQYLLRHGEWDLL